MTKKIKMYSLLKIKIKQIIESEYDLQLDSEQEKEYLIRQQTSPLFDQMSIVRGKDTDKIREFIFVEAKRNKKQEPDLIKLLREGFDYNGIHYVRFGKSPSQGKSGITTFIDERYFNEMTERSQLGLKIDKCVISKYESYRSLIFSSCMLIEHKLPYIVIVDEFEKTLKDQHIRYAEQKDIPFVDKVTGENKVYKNQKFIKDGVTDVELSPFDGFGVHTPEMSKLFSTATPKKHDSILFQIRLPFMKGVSVQMDFKKYFREVLKVEKIKDVFGKEHNIDDIDCLWNTSMWKGYKFFKEAYGNKAWDTYLERLNTYEYKLGISKYSHHLDELSLYSRLNFQYLQCLDLINPKYVEKFKKHDYKYDILDERNHGKIINLAKYSTDLLEKIIKGDKLYTLKFLGIMDTSDEEDVKSKYEEAILINDDMLHDISIKKMLRRKLNKTINQMKFGKIYTEGFYHIAVGDVIGYLEHCAKVEVKGCLKAGQFYTKTFEPCKCTSMRSPLVDPSEVNVIDVVNNDVTKKWLSHFEAHDVVMINMYDLTMPQQGGMDEDGDVIFLTNNEIVTNSKIHKPIVVDMEDKKGAEPVPYDMEHIITYELNTRDSRIGEITNIATSILNQYTEDKKWRKINEDNVALLRLYQGKEIDFLKTGFRWNITKNLRNHLKKLPYFILYNYPKKLEAYNKIKKINKDLNRSDKVEYNAFKSPSPMNELCDYITQWEHKRINWDNTTINNGHLMVDKSLELSNNKLIRRIKSIYNEFTTELRKYVDEDRKLKPLIDEYEEKLNKLKIEYQLSQKVFTNYCIKTAYRSISTDKTLCWSLYSDEMLSNLRKNSDERKECRIVECSKDEESAKEFLGRYYKLELVGDKLNA